MPTATLVRPAEGPAPTTTAPTAATRYGPWLLLSAFALVFVVQGAARITMPFGNSHDGRNGAVWGLESRAIREQGPLASRLGARSPYLPAPYADHPPLIAIETAAAEAVGGERPAVTRAPAWLGALATVALLYVLLRDLKVDALPAALGVVTGLGSGMFFLYGTMLDTLQTSLPFALGVLILWNRRRHGRGPRARWLAVACLLLVLASWEGALLVAVLSAADLLHGWRTHHRLRFPPTLAALAVGALLVGIWIWWADGGLGAILAQLRERTGTGTASVSWSSFANQQFDYARTVFNPVVTLLAVPFVVIALLDRRTRLLCAVTLGTACLYTLAMHEAAYVHDYWNYWLLVPLTIGAAATLDRMRRALLARDAARHGATIAITALGAVLALNGLASIRSYSDAVVTAAEPARVVQRTGLARGQRVTYVALRNPGSAPWVAYLTRARLASVTSRHAVVALARSRPDDRILVSCSSGPAAGTCPRLGDRRAVVLMPTVRELAAALAATHHS
ncbi:MAG: hypothetical protein U0V73_11275 [Acidimicrobiia bacterium]